MKYTMPFLIENSNNKRHFTKEELSNNYIHDTVTRIMSEWEIRDYGYELSIRADILKMFLTESIAIAVINSVLAVGLAALGCVFVNMYLKTKMFIPVNFALFTYRQALFIVGGAVITAILSSIIPIIKIAKEKPVNLISRSL